MHVFRNTILYLYNQHLIEFSLVNYLPAFLLFFLLLIVVVFSKGPKSWDEIEKEDREKATRKGLTYAAWLEARVWKKARAIPKSIRRAVFARDNYQRALRSAKALTLDHIFPFKGRMI